MKITRSVGIVSYGASLPAKAVSISSIEKAQGKKPGLVGNSLKIEQKTVPAIDEDTVTFATGAANQAIVRLENASKTLAKKLSSKLNKHDIGALFIGSESHPYAVKPSGTVVACALGLSSQLAMADLQFACKAGTQAMQICASYVLSGFAKLGLAIGADTAQASPGDALEYTASAGGAAFIFGSTKILATLLATTSVATDTPDFWRRPKESYPQHGGRFTGEPAYFKHVLQSSRLLLKETNLGPHDFDYCVFHTPNGKFPRQVAKKLGFAQEQLQPSLIVEKVGNTYAGAVPLALAAVLDQAKPGQKIFVTAYGSGAGADSFIFETTKQLVIQRKQWNNLVLDQINSMQLIDTQGYLRLQTELSH
ncbi:MAG: hypothetical protein XD95_0243 [Microgenomates bacterium 39_7]|nr:MAG: hypothetical protein XD95_0243 [Microgenomates bacterium 39_7]